MTWKTIPAGDGGDSTHFGADDGLNKHHNAFNGVADVDTFDLNSPFKTHNYFQNGIISPSQITSTQNNYAPTNGDKQMVWRLDANNSNPLITGIAVSQVEGMTRKLRNISANTIMLMNQHGGSTAANRFEFGGYDIPLFPKQELEIKYDDTIDRWFLNNPISGFMPPADLGFYAYKGYLRNSNNAEFNTGLASGGSASNVAGAANHLGVASWTLGTLATGNGFDLTATNSILLGNNWYHRFDCIHKVLQLSNATDNYTLRFGYIDSNSAESTDGAFFRYNHAVNSGNWQLVTRNNSTESVSNTSTAVQTANYVKLTIVVYPAGNQVDFFINDAFSNNLTSNIPTSSGRETGGGMMFLKSAGTTDTAFLNMDALQLLAYANTKVTT